MHLYYSYRLTCQGLLRFGDGCGNRRSGSTVREARTRSELRDSVTSVSLLFSSDGRLKNFANCWHCASTTSLSTPWLATATLPRKLRKPYRVCPFSKRKRLRRHHCCDCIGGTSAVQETKLVVQDDKHRPSRILLVAGVQETKRRSLTIHEPIFFNSTPNIFNNAFFLSAEIHGRHLRATAVHLTFPRLFYGNGSRRSSRRDLEPIFLDLFKVILTVPA